MGRTRKEKIMLQAVDETLRKYVSPAAYCLDGQSEGRTCLVRQDNGWSVAFYERGQEREAKAFPDLFEACLQLVVDVVDAEQTEIAKVSFKRILAKSTEQTEKM